jgi:hypothetical protein
MKYNSDCEYLGDGLLSLISEFRERLELYKSTRSAGKFMLGFRQKLVASRSPFHLFHLFLLL